MYATCWEFLVAVGMRSMTVAGAINDVIIGFQKGNKDFLDCRSSI